MRESSNGIKSVQPGTARREAVSQNSVAGHPRHREKGEEEDLRPNHGPKWHGRPRTA
jgi:hypothetical protein